MSPDNSLVTLKKYIFLMSSRVYFTPIMMDKEKLIIDWKITGVKIYTSKSVMVSGMNVASF